MTKVFVRSVGHDYGRVRSAVFEIMDSMGGESIDSGMNVLVKPNLLAPAFPENAVLTHHSIVKAAVEYALDRGATVQVSDSPATGSFQRILKGSGIGEALRELPVLCRPFERSLRLPAEPPFTQLELAEEALKADIIINLPKMKTHSQMLLTLAVKNLFGCVVGLRKPEWHMKTGVNRIAFARVLVQVYAALKPSFNILDGVLAMEGQGPGKSGTPRKVGVILGSKNAVALDVAVCRMLGVAPEDLLTNMAAGELGLMPPDIQVEGTLPFIADYRMPHVGSVVFGPEMFHGILRRHFVQRPEIEESSCKLCGECWKFCPAHALERSNEKVRFDYDRCIRCYCCLEVCPYGAISAQEPPAGRALSKTVRTFFRAFSSP